MIPKYTSHYSILTVFAFRTNTFLRHRDHRSRLVKGIFRYIPKQRRTGFTLIELMISLSLLVVLLGFVWGLTEMLSRSFVRGGARAERSQLVRSISQLVADDLSCAIQDPLHPNRSSDGNNTVRRFGLSGSGESIRIDIIQINPFRMGNMTDARVPELKTVYYDFALLAPTNHPTKRPGLTRRELDFEMPATTQPMSQEMLPSMSVSSTTLQTTAPNALPTTLPTMSELALQPETGGVIGGGDASVRTTQEQQLDMSAPEVVGCWFRYFDGKQWRDHWNSLESQGLPVAIEATLKLMPIRDAEMLRQSPIAPSIVNRPSRWPLTNNMPAQQGRMSQTPNVSDDEMAVGGGVAPTMGDISDTAPTMGSLMSGSGSPTLGEMMPQPGAMTQQETGSRGISVEEAATQLNLAQPVEQRVVIRVPTTPLQNQIEIKRELPKQSNANKQKRNTATPPDPSLAPLPKNSQPQNMLPQNQSETPSQSGPDWIRR